jgi:small subunit ribosomal protein S8
MPTTDPIADMLTRIRNAAKAKHKRVDMPSSQMKKAIAQILLDNKYILDFKEMEDQKQGVLRILLKYNNTQSVIRGLQRISTPGLRRYCGSENLPRVLNGLGIAIISTSKGVMTDYQAHQQRLGGEIVAHIW